MYSVQDAAPYTSSPVAEVLQHTSNLIRRRLAAREECALARLTARQKARPEVFNEPQTPIDTTPPPTTVTPTPSSTTPVPPRQPFQLRTCSQLNASLHRRDFHMRVNNQPGSSKLDEPPCVQRSCPFCRGPLLLQRFSLMQRLYQLNVLLYGHVYATDELQKA